MNTMFKNQTKLRQAVFTSAIILGGFAFCAITLLSVTEWLTRESIVESEKRTLLKKLNEVLPSSEYNNNLLEDHIQIHDQLLGNKSPQPAYRARKDGEFVAIFISGEARNGYNGKIKLLVGILSDDTVAGVRVISHKETPGLGDEIESSKSDWIFGFNQKSLRNLPAERWKVTKDGGVFDQFTGATITPRAVVRTVHNVLRFYEENKSRLIPLDKSRN